MLGIRHDPFDVFVIHLRYLGEDSHLIYVLGMGNPVDMCMNGNSFDICVELVIHLMCEEGKTI